MKFNALLAAMLFATLVACGGGGRGGDSGTASGSAAASSVQSSPGSSSVHSSATSASSAASSASSTHASSAASSSTGSGTASSGASSTTSVANLSYRSVNLSGAEFGESVLPGTYGTNYTYPATTEVDYFVGKDMNVIRLPFRWERLQQTLGGDFDAEELSRLNTFVTYATGKGAYVILDPHNYARYNGNLIGDGTVTQAHFADFWSRLASQYKSNSKVIFGLMNEPYGIAASTWLNAANAAIAAIRTTGATHLVLVPGISWTGAHSWTSSGNATTMLGVADSANNYAYEVHQYLDSDSSGSSATCTSTTIGAERISDFTSWLRTNSRKGFLGEFAGGANTTCQEAVTSMLESMGSNSDVWIGWAWWSAGPWWGSYIFTLEPSGSTDQTQMDWLTPYL